MRSWRRAANFEQVSLPRALAGIFSLRFLWYWVVFPGDAREWNSWWMATNRQLKRALLYMSLFYSMPSDYQRWNWCYWCRQWVLQANLLLWVCAEELPEDCSGLPLCLSCGGLVGDSDVLNVGNGKSEFLLELGCANMTSILSRVYAPLTLFLSFVCFGSWFPALKDGAFHLMQGTWKINQHSLESSPGWV